MMQYLFIIGSVAIYAGSYYFDKIFLDIMELFLL
jgi:hypothetical protein